MNLFGTKKQLDWSCNDDGLAVYLTKKSDYERISSGHATGELEAISWLFERLLESGDASVERVKGGIFIGSHEAVRLDAETRERFGLPSRWPGLLRLETHSVPNLSDFDAALRLVDVEGRTRNDWKLRGPILEVGEDCYLPDSQEYACLSGFVDWRNRQSLSEVDHLRLIHGLASAAKQGCRVDLSRADMVEVLVATECCVDAEVSPDGSIFLTPIPLAKGLPALIAAKCDKAADSVETFQTLKRQVSERVGQLDGESAEAVLRVGSAVVLLGEDLTAQARGIARNRRVPREQVAAFHRDPTRWMAENLFVHGEVEFLPRVIGIGEWTGGYLGAAGELGEKIDWFDKKPEPEREAKEAKESNSDGEDPPLSADFDSPTANVEEGPLVPIIEKNDEELRWGLREGNAADPDVVPVNPDFERYPRQPFLHQKEAINWLSAHSARCGKPARWQPDQRYWGAGALLADDMGLGKTLSTLVFLAEWFRAWRDKLGQEPPACLIVSPLSLVDNWAREIAASFTPEVNPFVRVVQAIPDGELRSYHATKDGKDRMVAGSENLATAAHQYGVKFGDGSSASLDQPGSIVLTTYTTLRDHRFSFAGCEWSAVVFDEAQNIKNPNALQTVAAKALKGFFRIALSGTPVENHLGDLWSLMDAVEPGALGSFTQFRSEWIHPIRTNPEKMHEIGEALRKRLDPLILRRMKESALEGLPKKVIQPVTIKMPERQALLYDEILRCANSATEEAESVQRNNRWLASMWELRRISLHPCLLGDANGERATDPDLSRKFFAQSGKLAWLLERLDEIRDKGEKVLIFSIQKKFQDLLCRHLTLIYEIKIPVINGDTKAISRNCPNETRIGLIDEFSGAAGFGICILSPIAAGAGLNITAANHVVHLERHWNPAKEDQATDRAFRIGQKKDVHVYFPMLIHPIRPITTFDTGLDMLIGKKKALAGSLGLIPVQPVTMNEIVDTILRGEVSPSGTGEPLKWEAAAKLSWDLFEALIAEVLTRESDRVILTPRGRDHGADVVAIGFEGRENILIQVKTTTLAKLDSEEAVREVEGSKLHFESILGLPFNKKRLHTNVRDFSRRVANAGKLYGVELLGADWLKSALAKHVVTLGDVIARNAHREAI
jgi:superfamily II DNA or RNA helicase